MRSPNRPVKNEVKNISIDQDLPIEDDDGAENTMVIHQPALIENACSQCSAFRANADHAWDILREFQIKNEENKKFKNEIHQLESQLKESRDYISVLRQQQQDYENILKEKDITISNCGEKIASLEDQYGRVLKAGREFQIKNEEIKKFKNDIHKLESQLKESRDLSSTLRNRQQDFENIIKEKDLRISNCNEKIANLEDRLLNAEQEFQIKHDENKKLKNDIHQLESQLKENRDCIFALRQQQRDYKNIIKEKDLRISNCDEKIASLQDQYGQRSQHNDIQASLEIDDDDLSLEMPLSPPVTHNANVHLLSMNVVFNSSFFWEHSKLELIDDLEDFDVFLPDHLSHSKTIEIRVPASETLKKFGNSHSPKTVETHGNGHPPDVSSHKQLDSMTFESQQLNNLTQIQIELVGESPKLEIHNISKKYNVDKKQAALLYTKAKRDANKKRQRKRRLEPSDDDYDGDSVNTLDTQKSEKVPRHLLPWVPYRQVVKTNVRSILSYEDHKRYVGIIVNQLQAVPKYRFEHNKMELQALDLKLESERNFYEKNALQTATQFKAFYFDPAQLKLFVDYYCELVKLYIGKHVFQGILCSIPWPQNNLIPESSTSLHFRTTKILSPGLAPSVQMPDIRRKIIFSNKPIRQMLFSRLKHKQPIDEDMQLIDFALSNSVQVAMDSSTLRHLLSAPWSQRAQNYACKLKVISRVFSGKLCKICVVSPPLIASRIHRPSIHRAFAKWGLKAYLFGTNPSYEEAGSSKPKDSCQLLLDDLGLGNIGSVDNNNNKGRKRYSIISFDDSKLENDQQGQHCVLIRTSLHANELRKDGHLQEISLTSRAEFLPEVGAEKLTNEEEIWNLATGLLMGSKEHLNFRLKVGKESSVLQYDRRVPNNFSQLSAITRSLLSSRIHRIKTLIDEISKLAIGEYLLMPNIDDQVLQIVEHKNNRCDELHSSSFEDVSEHKQNLCESRCHTVVPRSMENFYYDAQWFERLLKSKVICSQNELFDYWNGIDPHYPLQWHVLKSQIPGALYPKKS